jgi:hypothetical protein
VARARHDDLRRDLAVALPPWIVTRVVTLGALALCRYLVDHHHVAGAGPALRVRQGLFAWDAAYYRDIAEYGYHGVEALGIRFFPLVPLATRALAYVTGGNHGVALILIVNASALAVGALLHRLVLADFGDAALARRAVWLVAVAPPAFVLALGYAEATFMALAVATFLGLRTRRWWLAAACGALAALTRPIGALLMLPALIEVWRAWAATRQLPGERLAMIAAVLAPLAGIAAFLAWSAAAYHEAFRPLRAQSDPNLRGDVVSPITALLHEGRGIIHGTDIGSGLHVIWALGFIALLVVCARRLPLSYTVFAGAILFIGLSAKNLESFERYCLSAFPFVIGAATVVTRDWLRKVVYGLGIAGMAGYAVLSFLNASTP